MQSAPTTTSLMGSFPFRGAVTIFILPRQVNTENGGNPDSFQGLRVYECEDWIDGV